MRLIQDLLNSRAKIALLGMLLERSHAFSVSDLSRLASLPKATTSLVVTEWEKAGLVEAKIQGRNKLVKINQKFQLLPELKAIFEKSKNYHAPFFDKIRKLSVLKKSSVLAVIIFGSRVREDFVHASDLDVMIALENKNDSITEKIAEEFVRLSNETGIRFSPTFLDKKEIETRLKEKDHFIKNILTEGKIVKGGKWLEHVQTVS